VNDLFIPTIFLPILLQENMRTDPGNIKIAHRHMKVKIGNEAALLFWENINGIFVSVLFVCPHEKSYGLAYGWIFYTVELSAM
jgi:hypothetical protein